MEEEEEAYYCLEGESPSIKTSGMTFSESLCLLL